MARSGWYLGGVGAMAALALVCISTGMLVQGAAPPPLHPGPHPPVVHPPAHPGPGPGPGPVPPALRPRVIPRLRPVVIDDGPDVTVVRTVTELPPVPAPAPPQDAKAPAAAKAYKVLKVAENYTVTLDMDGKETTVRLLGVAEPQAPEGEARVRPVGQIGIGFMRNLLLNEYVTLASDPDLDKNDEEGVTTAYLYRSPDGLFTNLEVIRQGFGVVPTDYEFQHAKTFKFYQGKAKADSKGLWGRAKRGGREGKGPPAGAPAAPPPAQQ
jgi:endonuclease YncB( thermonuclease family)